MICDLGDLGPEHQLHIPGHVDTDSGAMWRRDSGHREAQQNQWWSKRLSPQPPQLVSFQCSNLRTTLVRRVYLADQRAVPKPSV
jgi:hypothetical protein